MTEDEIDSLPAVKREYHKEKEHKRAIEIARLEIRYERADDELSRLLENRYQIIERERRERREEREHERESRDAESIAVDAVDVDG